MININSSHSVSQALLSLHAELIKKSYNIEISDISQIPNYRKKIEHLVDKFITDISVENVISGGNIKEYLYEFIQICNKFITKDSVTLWCNTMYRYLNDNINIHEKNSRYAILHIDD